LSTLKKPIHNSNGEHYWEIGKAGYSLDRIIEDTEKVEFRTERTHRIVEMPYNGFFVLQKDEGTQYFKITVSTLKICQIKEFDSAFRIRIMQV